MPRQVNRLFFILALLALTGIALPADSIVGSWMQESQQMRWIFRADGSGFMETGKPKTTARFNWNLSPDGRTLQISTAGTSVPYQVIQNDGTSLVIVNQRVSRTYQLRRE